MCDSNSCSITANTPTCVSLPSTQPSLFPSTAFIARQLVTVVVGLIAETMYPQSSVVVRLRGVVQEKTPFTVCSSNRCASCTTCLCSPRFFSASSLFVPSAAPQVDTAQRDAAPALFSCGSRHCISCTCNHFTCQNSVPSFLFLSSNTSEDSNVVVASCINSRNSMFTSVSTSTSDVQSTVGSTFRAITSRRGTDASSVFVRFFHRLVFT